MNFDRLQLAKVTHFHDMFTKGERKLAIISEIQFQYGVPDFMSHFKRVLTKMFKSHCHLFLDCGAANTIWISKY